MSRVQTLAKQLFVATQVFCWWAIVCCGAVALVDLEARGPAARILIRHSLSYASVPGRHLLDSPVQRGIQRQVRRQLSQAAGAELAWISTGRNTGVDVLEVPQGSDAASIVQALRNVDGVEFAELDIHVKAYGKPRPGPPDDTEFWRQWGMHRLGLYTNLSSSAVNSLDLQGTAWNRSTGSDDVIVCVIDSGIDYNHPDLQANLWVNHHEIPANGIDDDNNGFVDDYYGWNFLNNSAKTMDDYFHGTHLAGIVGAVCNNELGVCGVNQRVKVMACKFLDQFGNGYTSNAVQCLDYALQMGAHISLNSYGGLYADSDGLRTAIGFAEAAGQLFVTAAGNDYGADIDQTPTFPAAYPNDNILSVIATNQSNLLANYSNYGAENADLAAPGSEILSTVPAAQYGWHTGTSQSAGFAAGAAALLLAAYQQAGFDISNCGAAVKAVMMGAGTTSQPGLADTCVTGGMLDLSSAMAAIPKQAPPPVPSAQPRCTHSTASTAQRWNVCQTCSLPWGIDAGAPGAAAPQVILPATQTSGSSKGDVKTKSLSLSDPFGSFTPSLTGPPASPVQVFSEIFGLQHSSLTLTPVAAGGFNSCLLKGVRDFQSDAAYGEDITATLLIPASAGKVDVFLPEAMPFKNGRVGSVSVTATGTLLLAFTALTTPPAPTSPPTAFGEPGGGSPPAPAGRAAPVQAAPDGSSAAQAKIAIFQAQELVSLAGSDVDLAAGGQVLHYLRPDRLVVSFLNVMSASSRLPSSFQAELFFRDASQPKGSIRLTWLDMAVQGALVGVSLGPACPAIQTDFALAVPCFQPATLSVSPARLPEMVQSSNAAMLHLTLSNTGNASLVVGASLETVGDNLLQPALWLNDALDYQKTYEQGSKTCSTYDPLRDPVCATFNISRQTVTYIGNYPKPMRFMQALKAPLRVVGTYVRNQQCSGQYIVLSSRPTPPTQFGEDGSVWFTMACARKYLYAPGSTQQSGASCTTFGPNRLDILVNATTVTFTDDQCQTLSASQPFGRQAIYLFIGAACTAAECPGGTDWTSLQILAGLPSSNSNSAASSKASPQTAGVPSSNAPAGPGPLLTGKSLDTPAPPALPAGQPQPQAPHNSLIGSRQPQLIATAQITHSLAAGSPALLAPQLSYSGSALRVASSPLPARKLDSKPSTATLLPHTRIVLRRGNSGASVDLSSLLSTAHAGQRASPGAVQANSIESEQLNTTSGGDAPGWVTLDKQVIKLASGQASGLHLACSGSLQAGNYGAELVLRSNDPNRPVLRMPIKFVVP